MMFLLGKYQKFKFKMKKNQDVVDLYPYLFCLQSYFNVEFS